MAAPPSPSEPKRVSTVSFTWSSPASGPHIASLITFSTEFVPAIKLGRAAARAPTVSSALQIASPSSSQALTIMAINIFIIRFKKASLAASKSFLNMSAKDIGGAIFKRGQVISLLFLHHGN